MLDLRRFGANVYWAIDQCRTTPEPFSSRKRWLLVHLWLRRRRTASCSPSLRSICALLINANQAPDCLILSQTIRPPIKKQLIAFSSVSNRVLLEHQPQVTRFDFIEHCSCIHSNSTYSAFPPAKDIKLKQIITYRTASCASL